MGRSRASGGKGVSIRPRGNVVECDRLDHLDSGRATILHGRVRNTLEIDPDEAVESGEVQQHPGVISCDDDAGVAGASGVLTGVVHGGRCP